MMLIALFCCSRKWSFHSINSGCNCLLCINNINDYYFRNNTNIILLLLSEINSAYWWGYNTSLCVWNGTGKDWRTYPFLYHPLIINYYYFKLQNDYTNHNPYRSWLIINFIIIQWFIIKINDYTNHNPCISWLIIYFIIQWFIIKFFIMSSSIQQ